MEVTDELKSVLSETAKQLKGSVRRQCRARTVKALGPGGASRAERECGWKRKTIRKGTHAVDSGLTCLDAFGARGRKRAEDPLPLLLKDRRAIVEGQSQTEPQVKTSRLDTRLTAAVVRRQLSAKFGDADEELPTAPTIGTTLTQLGYDPPKVAKSKPNKSCRPAMPSSSSSAGSRRSLRGTRRECVCPWMPKPRSRSATTHAEARSACASQRPTTI